LEREVTVPVLIDTHIFLWVRIGPEKLTAGELSAIESAQLRYVSAVTLWEFGILIGLGRIEPNERLLEVPSGYDLLPILPAHCKAYAGLPRRHRDPFDRMLVAQAQSEHLPLLTRDRAIAAYREQATILRFPEA
jgi:PIN domain nuclease of toxin-antitoxin system